MKIRKIKDSELDFLSQMLYVALFVPKGQDPLPKEIIETESISKYISNWNKDKYDIALVVEIENKLVGAIWGRMFDEANKGFGFIDNGIPELSMAVLPKFQNKGIGLEMLNTIFSSYLEMGIKEISLSVYKENYVYRLYKKVGFKVSEETETTFTMKKIL